MKLFEVVKWLFGLNTEERKTKAEEEKARFYALQVLNQEYRLKIEEQNDFIEKLQQGKTQGTFRDCIEREIDLHLQRIEQLKYERDLREQIIFLNILNKQTMKETISKLDAAIELCEDDILKDLLKSIKKDLEAQEAGIETPPPPKNP